MVEGVLLDCSSSRAPGASLRAQERTAGNERAVSSLGTLGAPGTKQAGWARSPRGPTRRAPTAQPAQAGSAESWGQCRCLWVIAELPGRHRAERCPFPPPPWGVLHVSPRAHSRSRPLPFGPEMTSLVNCLESFNP